MLCIICGRDFVCLPWSDSNIFVQCDQPVCHWTKCLRSVNAECIHADGWLECDQLLWNWVREASFSSSAKCAAVRKECCHTVGAYEGDVTPWMVCHELILESPTRAGKWLDPDHILKLFTAFLLLSDNPLASSGFLLPGGLVAGSDGCTILTGSEPNSIEIVFVSSSYNLIYCTFTTLTLVTAKTFHHPFKPACSLLFSSFPHSPLFQTVQSKYLKFSSFTSAFCNLPVPLHSLSFTYRSSVYEFLHYSPLSGL